MQTIKFMVKAFLNEPLWFKLLITITFLASIILSSSSFSNYAYMQSLSKLAAAIFFLTYGLKIRRNFKKAIILYVCTTICIYLSITSIF